jgi:hypothetical protein
MFDNNLVDDYKDTSLFLGCSSPDCDSEKHRYYGEVDINHFSVIKNSTIIANSKSIYKSKDYDIIKKRFYSEILFFYDFETTNNIGVVYDNSKNTHFLEKVPNQFVL